MFLEPWLIFFLQGTLLANLAWKPALGNLWESLGTCSWEHCSGTIATSSSEPETLLGNRTLGTLLGTPAWEPALGNVKKKPVGIYEPLRIFGNLFLQQVWDS